MPVERFHFLIGQTVFQDAVRPVGVEAGPVFAQRFLPGDVNVKDCHPFGHLLADVFEGAGEPAMFAAASKLDDGCFAIVISGVIAQLFGVFQTDSLGEHVPKISV